MVAAEAEWVTDNRAGKAKDRKAKKAFRAACLKDFEAKEWSRVCKVHEEEAKKKWDLNQEKAKNESQASYEVRARQAIVAACRNFARDKKEEEFEKYMEMRRQMLKESIEASTKEAKIAPVEKKAAPVEEKKLVYVPASVQEDTVSTERLLRSQGRVRPQDEGRGIHVLLGNPFELSDEDNDAEAS